MSSVRTPETSVCGASCGATIPITWHHCSLILMYSPIAAAAPKRLSFAAAPRTHTGAAASFSEPSKKRPSVTRRWLVRFSNPKTISGSHCCRDLGSAMELGFIVMRRVSIGTGTQAGIRASTALAVAAELFLRIHQSNDSSRRQATEDCPALADRADFDFLHFKSAVAFAIHHFFAVVLEDCSPRNRNRARKIVAEDA